MRGTLQAIAQGETAGKIVSVVNRAAALLECFDNDHASLTLGDLSNRMALPKPSVFRIATGLVRNGFLEHDEDKGVYGLGGAVHRLSETLLAGMSLRKIALPAMKALRDDLNETVILSVREAYVRYNIDSAESTHAIGQAQQIGVPIPLYAGAASRVMLAALGDEELDSYLKAVVLRPFSDKTIISVNSLREAIARVRNAGYASTSGEFTPGSHAIARLVKTPDSMPTAALHVSIPAARYSSLFEARAGKRLRDRVTELERTLIQQPRSA
ncbi:MAG: IclR family transcriptional regulator [Acidimicrobiales bacterium]|nr:IclR family transcriptional regulator [Acidimicrobiales bacterium]